MGMQISRSVYSEVPAQGAIWTGTSGVGRSVPGVSTAEREPHRRRAFAARSCAYAGVDFAQVRGRAGGGVSESEECDLHCTYVWRAATEVCGGTRLGARLLCDNGRAGRRGRPAVHPGAGGGGAPVSATRAV